jgi:hypothetical protein
MVLSKGTSWWIASTRQGMLEEERRDDARRVYYERTDSPLWKIIEAAADVIEPE